MGEDGRYAGVFLNWNNPITISNSDSRGIDLEMSKNNKHVDEYLKSFIEMSNPEFGVMLKGKWGCGKTYFIKSFIDTIRKNNDNNDDEIIIDPIYISLNGINTTESINELIRREISPFLHSKNMKKLKGLAKSLIKGSLKLDLNVLSDIDEEAKLTIDLDPINLFKTKDPRIKSKKLIVFDDIERARIDIDILFGFLNSFVEHNQCKVIIIADEIKLCDYQSDEKKKEYKTIKEKLIGKTFEIRSDVKSFIKNIVNDNEMVLNEKEEELIKSIFAFSRTKNLRILKQTILEFKSFIFKFQAYKHLETYHILKWNLLFYFFVTSFEYRAGNTEIVNYQSIKLYGNNKREFDNSIDSKYNINAIEKLQPSYNIIPIKYIYLYIESGIEFTEKISNLIVKSEVISNKKPDDWEVLWKWRNINDELFKEKLNLVWDKFEKHEIDDIQVLFHISGVFLNLIEENLIDKELQDIVFISKTIIDKITSNPEFMIDIQSSFFYDSSYQREYQSKRTKEFKDVINYFIEKNNNNLQNYANNYLDHVFYNLDKEEDVFSLFNKLKKTHPKEQSTYEMTALFEYLDATRFIEVIKKMGNESINKFNHILEIRYDFKKYPDRKVVYTKEIKFWKKLLDELQNYLDLIDKNEKIKVFTINNLKVQVEKIISIVEL